MTRAEWLADRRNLLAEAGAIEADLTALEERRGHDGGIDDLRRRVQRVRLVVLTELVRLRDTDPMPEPEVTVADFVTWLEDRGATLTFRHDTTDWHLNLDGVPDMTRNEAAVIATAALTIRDEIRVVLPAGAHRPSTNALDRWCPSSSGGQVLGVPQRQCQMGAVSFHARLIQSAVAIAAVTSSLDRQAAPNREQY